MKTSKRVLALVFLLVLMNIGLISYILMCPPHPKKGPHFDKLVVETLALSDEQLAKFDAMKKEHRRLVDSLSALRATYFGAYMDLLSTGSVDSTAKANWENKAAEVEKTLLSVTFKHFADMKAMCTPAQQEKFKLLVPGIVELMSPPKPPQRPKK